MRRILVDAHALLWWLANDPALPAAPRALIADSETDPLVSIASLWEVAIKRGIGKLDAPDDLPQVIEDEEFSLLGIEPAHAWAVRALPHHHRDPFDRMLVAQAQLEGVPLITGDPRFAAYDVEVRWD